MWPVFLRIYARGVGIRHFYTTQMLKGGATLEAVARILGHAGVGAAADIYRHVAMAEVQEST